MATSPARINSPLRTIQATLTADAKRVGKTEQGNSIWLLSTDAGDYRTAANSTAGQVAGGFSRGLPKGTRVTMQLNNRGKNGTIVGLRTESVPQQPKDGSPKYPNVKVQLAGQDGNAFFIIGRVDSALRRAGVPQEKRDKFITEAQSGDYGNLLRTVNKWVKVS